MVIESTYGVSGRAVINKNLINLPDIPSNGTLAIYASDTEITKNIGSVSWKNSIYELATTLSFETAKTDNAYLKDLIYTPKLGEVIRIVTNIEVFRSVVVKVDDGDKNKNKYTAVDMGWYLNKTSQTYQFTDITVKDAIKEICADLSIPIDDICELNTKITLIYFDKTVSDMIITKSISRFARNTLDCLKYIRELKDKNIPVFFEKENINTMDSKGEVLLTIMASLAQQESQSLSQNVKLGLQYRYQNGEVQVNHNRFLGYTKDEDGHLIIEPKEAEIVKRIYREYLEGQSLIQIARGLEKDGILTAAKKAKWRPETLRKILQNEKYIGDALLQKTYTVDFLTKKRVKNDGIVPQYYVENSHEPIIPRELYMRVQEEMVRRANLHSGQCKKKRVYSSKYALSSIVYCTTCGDIYRRVAWNNRGKRSNVWRCCTRIEHGPTKCDAPTILESDLHNAVVNAINITLGNRDYSLRVLQENIEEVLKGEAESSIKKIEERLEELQRKLLWLANSKQDYNEVVDEIYRLREEKRNALADNAERQGLKQRIKEMSEFMKEQSKKLDEYDEQLVRRLIEKIIVYEDRFEIGFKSGLSVDVNR